MAQHKTVTLLKTLATERLIAAHMKTMKTPRKRRRNPLLQRQRALAAVQTATFTYPMLIWNEPSEEGQQEQQESAGAGAGTGAGAGAGAGGDDACNDAGEMADIMMDGVVEEDGDDTASIDFEAVEELAPLPRRRSPRLSSGVGASASDSFELCGSPDQAEASLDECPTCSTGRRMRHHTCCNVVLSGTSPRACFVVVTCMMMRSCSR